MLSFFQIIPMQSDCHHSYNNFTSYNSFTLHYNFTFIITFLSNTIFDLSRLSAKDLLRISMPLRLVRRHSVVVCESLPQPLLLPFKVSLAFRLVCVCVFVSVCVCVCVCFCVFLCVFVCFCVFLCVFVCFYVFLCVFMCIQTINIGEVMHKKWFSLVVIAASNWKRWNV